ncbi:uncharacterized protein BX663DRAFT_491926 [Cokeromyces recurvatus]|uniref:uncharacterized protein n=1 Tax=Cokeromyces recurvatus TaxID=90255 RepID=UPI002220AACD|nr:uncharacterized protein BX663DRAFT_491926 [Cokeromyces recurvatus]KAI7907753.1 hypothetical protein BX663DRAFT_491926 [Cokeromyces recurvatus]
MLQGKNKDIIHISLLYIIQYLSISVIILNALALNETKNTNQGLIIAAKSGPQEYILLILGAISLFAAFLLLCSYLRMVPCLLENKSILLSKRALILEICLSAIIIFLWTLISVNILMYFHGLSSCKKRNISVLITDIYFDKFGNSNTIVSSKACNFANTMIIISFVTISVWLLVLLSSIYSFSNIKNRSSISDLFIMQEPILYENQFQTNQFSNRNTVSIINTYSFNITKIENEEKILNRASDHLILNNDQQRNTLLDLPSSPPRAILATNNRHFDFTYLKPINLGL